MNLKSILKVFDLENLDKTMKSFDECMGHFNKAIQDFGNSIDKITGELSSDIEKSNRDSEAREKKNQENLDKIWGKKK